MGVAISMPLPNINIYMLLSSFWPFWEALLLTLADEKPLNDSEVEATRKTALLENAQK